MNRCDKGVGDQFALTKGLRLMHLRSAERDKGDLIPAQFRRLWHLMGQVGAQQAMLMYRTGREQMISQREVAS